VAKTINKLITESQEAADKKCVHKKESQYWNEECVEFNALYDRD